jgi:hypothetical protein
MFIEAIRLPAAGDLRHPLADPRRHPERGHHRARHHGMRRSAWDDLDIVDHWRRYLADPRSYLRRFIDPE